ncbi:MAG: toprim domain-containing protein, partial [Lachnospiraceae bacterium]|nr:toprim domain-containing protein [Lachnospiraceae bacterium]
MKYLFIAEKPSLMRDVQACYRNHKDEVVAKVGEIDFTALSGHVCTNYMPTDYDEWKDKSWKAIVYPMIPEPWQFKAIADRRKQDTIQDSKRRAADYDGIVVGTDSDQEGYGIYYLLEQYLGLDTKPALRFMEHSLTDAEIL